VSELVRVLVVSLVAIAGGAAGVAAYTVGARVATLAVVPALGMQQAAQSMIGQKNLGADAPHRARRTTMVGTKLVVVGFLALGAVQFLFAGAIADLLAPDLTATGRSLSVLYLRILAVTYWALGGTYTLLAGFNGASRTRTSFVADLIGTGRFGSPHRRRRRGARHRDVRGVRGVRRRGRARTRLGS